MKQELHPFDALIRSRLSELPPPEARSGGWDRLEDSLDHPEDAVLRDALSSLAPSAPVGWEALEAKLAGRSAADLHLAERLNALEPALAAGSWAALAGKLDARTEAAVDEIVNEGLRVAAPGIVTGWAALAARLELIRERRHCVVATKITEVSLLASLLLLFLRFAPFVTEGPPVLAHQPPAATEFAHEAQPKSAASAATTLEPAAAAAPSTRRSYVPHLVETPRIAGVRTNQAQTDAISERAVIVPLREPVADAAAELSVSTLAQIHRDARPPHPSILLPELPRSAKPVHLYLDVFLSPFDLNQVITENYEPVVDLEVKADNRLVQGASAGALLGVMQGNSGIQLGLIYSETSYIPSVLKEASEENFGPIEPVKGYSRFRYESLSVPFSYHYIFRETGHWRWSARATATVSVIAGSEFINEDPDLVAAIQRREEFFAANNPGVAGRSNTADRYRLTNPSPGWLEGGDFFDNANIHLGGGLMVERLISSRSSVYVSPTIRRAVYFSKESAGTGPYDDRIHVGQIRFGVRHLLNGK